MRIATVGVYGFSATTFLDALAGAAVGLVIDIRQRRGVRGAEYAWANSTRLQALLADAGVEYRHVKELAPTTELRQVQYRDDDRRGVGKRNRRELAAEYAHRYRTEILEPFDLGRLVAELPRTTTTALLCVERDAVACHRSLVTDRLTARYGVDVVHLAPNRSCPRS